MNHVKVIPVTPQMRAQALWRDYQRRPRVLRLTPGHVRYIQKVAGANGSQIDPGHEQGRAAS